MHAHDTSSRQSKSAQEENPVSKLNRAKTVIQHSTKTRVFSKIGSIFSTYDEGFTKAEMAGQTGDAVKKIDFGAPSSRLLHIKSNVN